MLCYYAVAKHSTITLRDMSSISAHNKYLYVIQTAPGLGVCASGVYVYKHTHGRGFIQNTYLLKFLPHGNVKKVFYR